MDKAPPIKLLLLEDVAADARLALRRLAGNGLEVLPRVVDNREDFEKALGDFTPDVILGDYSLPAFDGLSALRIARGACPQIPFIFLSGTMGEERAIEALHEGAVDYVLKSNLSRLVPAVERALREAKERAAKEKLAQALRRSQDQEQLLLSILPLALFSCAPSEDHLVTWVSDNIERLSGFTPAQFLSGPLWRERIHPEDRERVFRERARVFDKGSITHEHRWLHKSGEYRWFLAHLSLIRDAAGAPKEMAGTWLDITDRKRSENALLESSEKLDLALKASARAAWDWDIAADTVRLSPHWSGMLGYAPGEVDPRTAAWAQLVHPEDDARVRKEAVPALLKGEIDTLDVEFRMRAKDGSWRWINTVGKVVSRDAANRAVLAMGTHGDVTARKQNEESLRVLNRALRTLSSVSAVLVHAKREDQLLEEVCQVLVKHGRYDVAAIAYTAKDRPQHLQVMARCGEDGGYFAQRTLKWENGPSQGNCMGAAIRSGQNHFVNDVSAGGAADGCLRDLDALGFRSFVSLPLREGERVFGALALLSREPNMVDDEEAALLSQAADDVAYGIFALRNEIRRTEAEHDAVRNLRRLTKSMESAIEAIALTVEKRDPYTAGHQRKVAELAAAIAREMGFSADRIQGLRLGAIIHDIGKVYVPAEILNRPGKLTEHEFGLIKTHAEVGYDIVKNIDFPWPVAQMVRHHHERLDGSGYPDGLRGDEILLEARILAVADVVEAITAHRPYRPALGMQVGIAELIKGRGTIFDAQAVDACVRVLREGRFDLPAAEPSGAAAP